MLTAEQKIAEHPLLLQRIAALEAKLSSLQKQVLGGVRSEKLDPAQRDLALGLGEAKAAVEARTERISYERSRSKPRPTPGASLTRPSRRRPRPRSWCCG